MKALITGASGFVGQHLVTHLLTSGDEVIALGREDKPATTGIKYLSIDLLDARATAAIPWGGIEVVYHLAGLAAVGPSFDDPEGYMQTNTGIQENLFNSCKNTLSRPRFIVISTGGVYDPKAPLPLTEDSSVAPSSPYGASKLAQEHLALEHASQGYDTVIARPFNHIGPGQSEGFLVADLAKQIISNELVKVGNLAAKRDYTDVRDIVRAYRLLARVPNPQPIYNVCGGKSVSGEQILDNLLRLHNTKAKIVTDPERMRPSDTPDIYGSYDRLHADTGWAPQINIQTTLRDVLADWGRR